MSGVPGARPRPTGTVGLCNSCNCRDFVLEVEHYGTVCKDCFRHLVTRWTGKRAR